MRHILAVDDDMHIGHAIRIWLKHHGFLVSTADSGPGGLAALDNAKSASAGAEAPTEARRLGGRS